MWELLLFLLPPYIANSSPVILGGSTPLDGGRYFFDKKRLLGSSKTLEGFVGGVAAGTLTAVILAFIAPLPFFDSVWSQVAAGFMLSLGTLVGDALGSFIKRRFSRKEGSPFFLDTFFFIVVALVFAFPFTSSSLYTPTNLLFIISLSIILHPLTNVLAYFFGFKSVPW